MNKLRMLILSCYFCCYVPFTVFSSPLITTGNVPLKVDSVIGYTFVSKTDSAINAKVIYEYSADSLEVCHHAYNYNKESQKWIPTRVDSTVYDNLKRKIKIIAYTYNVNTTKWTPVNKTSHAI